MTIKEGANEYWNGLLKMNLNPDMRLQQREHSFPTNCFINNMSSFDTDSSLMEPPSQLINKS